MLCSMYANAECVYVISLTEWRVRDVDIAMSAKCFGRMVEWVSGLASTPPPSIHNDDMMTVRMTTANVDRWRWYCAPRCVCIITESWAFLHENMLRIKKNIFVFYVFSWWSLCPPDVPAFALDSGSPQKCWVSVLVVAGFGRCQLLTNAHKPDAGDVHTIQSQMPGVVVAWYGITLNGAACMHTNYMAVYFAVSGVRSYHIKLCAHQQQHHIMPATKPTAT